MRALLLFSLLPFMLNAQAAPPSPEIDTTVVHKSFRMGVEMVVNFNASPSAYFYQGRWSIPIWRRAPVLNVYADYVPWQKHPFLRLQFLLARHRAAFDERLAANYIVAAAQGPPLQEKIRFELVQVGVGLHLEPRTAATVAPYLRANFLMGLPQHLRYESIHQNDDIELPAYRRVEGGTRISPGWKMGAGVRIQPLPELSFQIGLNYVTQSVKVNWPEFVDRYFRGEIMRWRSAGASIGVQAHW